MAGGIAHGKENGFVFLFCPPEGFVTPRIPVHGVSGMLNKVRTLLVKETIRNLMCFSVRVGHVTSCFPHT
jgi:hypothetical protein